MIKNTFWNKILFWYCKWSKIQESATFVVRKMLVYKKGSYFLKEQVKPKTLLREEEERNEMNNGWKWYNESLWCIYMFLL